MTISFLDENFGTTFSSLMNSSNREIKIVSPFIGFRTASALADFIEKSEEIIECIVITRFDREDFINGVSSIAGLERLVKAGVKIYALQSLHTKLYIFNKESIIMGSANFTFNGFYKNHEFGIFMENEKVFAEECNAYFEGLLSDINESGDWEVTVSIVENEKRICDNSVAERAFAQKKPGKNSFPVIIIPNSRRWGATLPFTDIPNKDNDNNDFLEAIFHSQSEETTHERNTGIWLKFEGNSENRIPNELSFFERRKKEHMKRTFFPTQPTGIKQGQTLFMTMVSRDLYGNDTPMIVGYVETSGYKKSNIVHGSAPFATKDHGRYPYYVEFVKGRFLSGPIKNGISLRELARELNIDLYPNPKSDFNEIIYTHRQKSHLQITKRAHDYIIKRLETLFISHGVDEL